MNTRLHPHALLRLEPRGVTEEEAIETVETGIPAPALRGRTVFRKTFQFGAEWAGKRYATKTVEAFAVDENGWLVITVIAKFGGRLP